MARSVALRRRAARLKPAEVRARILVVDDEPLLRSALARVLRDDYDVVTVGDGARALALLRSSEHFDVILCDLSMPLVGGAVVYLEAGLVAPETTARFVFMHGGATTAADRSLLHGLDQPTLEKPFTNAEMKAAIEAILDRTGRTCGCCADPSSG